MSPINSVKGSSEELLELIKNKNRFSVNDLLNEISLGVEKILDILSELESAGIISYISYDSEDVKNSMCEVNNSYLDHFNLRLHKKTLKTKQRVERERMERGYVNFGEYNINLLLNQFFGALSSIDGISSVGDINISYVDRNKFDADICITIPELVKNLKGGGYIKETVPLLVAAIKSSKLFSDGIIEQVETKGIYINIKLTDNYLLGSLEQLQELGDSFGDSDINKGKAILVDYSSPNTAKHLHAGHIRSTIIGHILGNIYTTAGYTTHRVNHINDWGGFGYLIEGYESWKDILPEFEVKNDMLFFIYTIYRLGEKASSGEEAFSKLDEEKIADLKKYYGDFSDYGSYVVLFNEFLNKTKTRFSNLEKGEKEEFEIWEKMVEWSKEDFERFYNILGIHQDYVIGESFYSNMGRNLVKRLESEQKVLFYTSEYADQDISILQEKLDSGEIEEQEFKTQKREILADIGCYLVRLPNFERFVVLKADESTIYATRDLAAIKYRSEVFEPSRIVYEVGQEQAEHFDKLFKSGEQIGVEGIGFSHIYHGFYVDAKTKKKLSSRDGASNVQKLIKESIEYFKRKYEEDNKGFSEEEIDYIAHSLAIGSIIFNDIKKDKKSPVFISGDIDETCKTFESSGGAYITYSICRARSIIKRYNKEIPDIKSFSGVQLEPIEKSLIIEMNKFPFVIQQASSIDNPALLAEYLSNLARLYNSYYNACPVLDQEKDYRLIITSLVSDVLVKGMNICHIQIPEKI